MRKKDAVAEKTLAKIRKEEDKLAGLELKKEELENQIKECKAGIAELRKQEKREKLEAIAELNDKAGISLDDLLKAAQSGDFFSLQEKLEQVSEPHDTSVSADTDAE
jgi:predicted  nucleic acid-binding Zn-ribbon protein